MSNAPYVSTVGIRQVRSDGEVLDPAMVLDVLGDVVSHEPAEGSTPDRYVLDLSEVVTNDVLTEALSALQSQITTLQGQVATLTTAVGTLNTRVTALETQRLTPTALKSADYTAVAWQHVLVDMAAAAGNVTITMPTSPAPTVGDRVRVSDVSASGGSGKELRVAATFAPTSTTHYAVSPYPIGEVGGGESLKGANAELVYVGTGWYVVAETVEPEGLI